LTYALVAAGSGTFLGTFSQGGASTAINNEGVIASSQMVRRADGSRYIGLFRVDSAGRVSTVAVPGDPAPGNGVFDYAAEPSINTDGAVAFLGPCPG
jgi:hypothetical protein